MEVASGAFAVVSLGIQLVESVQKLRNFLRGVKEAPEELQRLIAKINLLYGIFNHANKLIEQQRNMPSHHGLIPLFADALKACEKSVDRLEKELAHVQGSSDDGRKTLKDRPKGSLSKRHALRSVLRKETVDELCSIVDESIRSLDLVVSLSSNQLLLANMNVLVALERRDQTIRTVIDGSTAALLPIGDAQQTTVVEARKTRAGDELSMIEPRAPMLKQSRHSYYKRLWGYVRIQEEVQYTHDETKDRERIIVQRSSTVFAVPFLRTFLEWQLLRSYGQVSRSLRYYPRMAKPSLYFPSFAGLVRILMDSQSDLEAADIQEFYRNQHGPPEGPELVFSYDMSLGRVSDHQDFQIRPLHVALLHLGGGAGERFSWRVSNFEPNEWLYLVCKLLRGTVDLHAQCEGLFSSKWHFPGLLTSLQCLLLDSCHPCDGLNAAKTWLALLHEANHDQVAYLNQELLLYAQDEITESDAWYQIPEGTRCFYGPRYEPATIMFVHLDPPRVWWDWYIEPECEAYHVLHEFRNFNIHHQTLCTSFTPKGVLLVPLEKWSEGWPFCYPYCSEESRPEYSDKRILNAWEEKTKKGRARLARRADKPAQKLTRSQRRQARRPLPGAWVE